MSPILESLGIDRLSVAERILLVEDIWDSIAASPERVPVTDAQMREIRRRYDQYKANPDAGSSWEDVRARLKARLKERK